MAAKLNNVDVVKASTSREGEQIKEITEDTAKLNLDEVKEPKKEINGKKALSLREARRKYEFFVDKRRKEEAEDAIRLDTLSKESTVTKLEKLNNKLKFIENLRNREISFFDLGNLSKDGRNKYFESRGYAPFPLAGIPHSDYDSLLFEVTNHMAMSDLKLIELYAHREVLRDEVDIDAKRAKRSSSR